MLVAAVAALAAGTAQSLSLLFLQGFLDTGGSSQAAGAAIDMSHVVRSCLLMLTMSGSQAIAAFVYYSLGSLAAARQKRRWKISIMAAILQQDVGWFDIAHPEELSTTIAESVELIAAAMGGKIYLIFQSIGLAAGGFAIGFSKSWDLALVMCSGIPIVCLAALLMIRVISGSAGRRMKAYSGAGGTATEALFAMRTVASLGLEEKLLARYNHDVPTSKQHPSLSLTPRRSHPTYFRLGRYEGKLEIAKKAEALSGPANGFGTGVTLASVP